MNKENIALWVDKDTHTAIKTAAAMAGLTIKSYLRGVHNVSNELYEFDDFLETEFVRLSPELRDEQIRDEYNDWISEQEFQTIHVFATKFKSDAVLGAELAREFCKSNGIPVN